MSKFGGGGNTCTKCNQVAYPAETIQHEKKPYHVDCFKCATCDKKMESAAKAQAYEDEVYCEQCFKKNGFSNKQKDVKWVKKEGGEATNSKFGGGGTPCTVCQKTVYPAEMLSFEKQPYHMDCFACSQCQKKMTASSAAQYEDQLFCVKCFQDGGYARKQTATRNTPAATGGNYSSKFGGGGVKCTVCEKTVYAAETVSYEKLPYHADCFKCSVETCGKKIAPSGAAAFEGAIFCVKCFSDGGYARKQTATAKAPGTTTTTTTNSKFGGGGNKCYSCQKTVYAAETIQYEKKPFHEECFKCKNCAKKVSPSGAEAKRMGDDIEVYCSKCWKDLGLNRAKVDAGATEEVPAEEAPAEEVPAE